MRGHQVGRRKTRRYMTKMGIDPLYPKMNLSKRMQQVKVCPYLLRNAVIDRPKDVYKRQVLCKYTGKCLNFTRPPDRYGGVCR